MHPNKVKQIAAFVVMCAVMIGIGYLDIELYRTLMTYAGALAIGATVGKWARDRWPT